MFVKNSIIKVLLIFLMIGFYSFGQNKPKVIEPPSLVHDVGVLDGVEDKVAKSDIADFPDVEAEFPCHTFYQYDTLGNVSAQTNECGISAMMQFLSENINYPETAVEMGEQGRVFLQFIVEKDGSITNVKVDKGVSSTIDKEAIRVVQKMPKWNPGQVKGRNVRSKFRIPINFRLN
jgi:TonB family protein